MERTFGDDRTFLGIRIRPDYLPGGMLIIFLVDVGHATDAIEVLARLTDAAESFLYRFALPHRFVAAEVYDLYHAVNDHGSTTVELPIVFTLAPEVPHRANQPTRSVDKCRRAIEAASIAA